MREKCTSKIQLLDQHKSLLKECENNLLSQLHYENDEVIEELINKLYEELNSSYADLQIEFESIRNQILEERLQELMGMFCSETNKRIKPSGVVTKSDLEKDLLEVEKEVYKQLEAQNLMDSILFSDISKKVII